MQTISVDDTLLQHGLAAPRLNVLVPDQANYRTLLFQPEGNITADSNGVRNSNAELADEQYSAFLRTAMDANADLVVTPEYSLPWRILEASIENEQFPSVGSLWVLGCESIQFEGLSAMAERLSDKATFIYEQLEPDNARFLDPLAYVFQTTLADSGETRLVILIQFKTCPMGDEDHFEVDGLLRGTQLYRFGGTDSQLRLITLICSDAFAFTEAKALELYDRTLVIHIQLNPNPRQNLFRIYRTHLFKSAGDQTEIITLNWAKDVQADLGQGVCCWNNIAGSGWYLRPDRFDTGDPRLQHNHKLGLYYTWLNTDRCHALFFAYEPAVFLIVATKVAHIGVAAPLSKRKGPKMVAIYNWNFELAEWQQTDKVDDKFSKVSAEAGEAEAELLALAESRPLAVERILAVCSGDPIAKAKWYHVTELDSFEIDATEVVKRVTCCHDTKAEAVAFRRSRVKAGQRTSRLLRESLPPALSDFAGGYRYEWDHNSPHTNVVSQAGRRATAIALDDNHSRHHAEKIRDTVAEYLRRTANSADDSLDAMQRLHVWYRDEQGRDALCDPHRFVKYDQTSESPFDIGRES